MSEATERERLSRLLIVEDDESQLRTLTDLMAGEGFDVIGCTTAAEALEHVRQEDFGVAVVDLRLPDLNGTQLLEKINALNGKVRVIINTAYASFDSAKEALNLGAFAYVEKAGDPGELIRQVHAASRWHYDRYAKDLEEAVASRTAELRTANEGLRSEIAERKQAEEALRTSEDRYRTLFDVSSDGILIADSETKQLRHANPAAFRMLGYSEQELTQLSVKDIHPEESLACIDARFEAQARGDKTLAEDIPYLRKDGTILYADIAAATIELQGRKCTVGLFRDITERKRAEKERQELEAQLRQSQKMEAIGQLAGGVAHDFNNLLTAILGNSEILLTALAEKAAATSEELLRPGLEQIQSAGEQAASLTRQLLAFSRREITRPEVLDPKKVVGDMEGLLRRLIGEHIQLDIRLSAETYFILADPGQIEQIVLNLVVNAADAMPNGGRLEIRVEEAELSETSVAGYADAKPGRHVLLSVVDNGTGITPETLERMFEPFFTTKSVGKGTGLGLATVYGTVKQLGGHISGDSKPGVGSTFNVCIPIVDKKAAEKEPHDMPTSSYAGETILVCEDQDLVRNVMCQALRAAGYTVIEVDNGKQALEAVEAHDGTIDILISDVIMPGMSGKELADSLATEHPDTHVLFVSGYTADHLDDHGVRSEAVEFLQKPFGPTALLRRVREVLDVERAIG